MKRFFLGIFLIAASTFSASAQLFPTVQFGLKGGANFANIKDINLESSSRTGYLVGVWARLGGAGVHFQPELYLTSKGAELNNEGDIDRMNFTTLDLPLLLGTRVGLGPIAARVQVGPVISFVMDKDDSFLDNVSAVGNFKDYKNQTVSLTAGLGADIMKLRADLRYEHGVTDVFKNNDDNGRLSLWTVSIGYRLF
ncbi:MAG TPA: porin family protein [Sphingobacteriaceae bacterium]|nr:porin family protein [Sphingobacteriaceae bacterium]